MLSPMGVLKKSLSRRGVFAPTGQFVKQSAAKTTGVHGHVIRRKSADGRFKPQGKISPLIGDALDPVVEVISRHVDLTPALAKVIRRDLDKLLAGRFEHHQKAHFIKVGKQSLNDNLPLRTQEAADLIGVSRPFLVRHIDAGDIPLHSIVGNQRRVLKKDVLAWHERQREQQRAALAELGAALDDEIFSD